MANKTAIEWTDRTWSPLRVRVRADAAAIAEAKGYTSLLQIAEKMAGAVGPHCEHVSPGCELCYSGTNNRRCLTQNGTGLPFDRRSRDLVDPFVDERILIEPLKWRKPQRVFVENQSDLFGYWYTNEMIDRVFAMASLCPQLTLQILTKRSERLLKYFSNEYFAANVRDVINSMADVGVVSQQQCVAGCALVSSGPLPNVWLGVSVEDQPAANARRPAIEGLSRAGWLTFVSYEPALAPVDWEPWRFLDWLIIGGESGRGARPLSLRWVRSAIRDFSGSRTALFLKQMGKRAGTPSCANFECTHPDCSVDWLKLEHPKGGNPDEWPEEFRGFRQFPAVRPGRQ